MKTIIAFLLVFLFSVAILSQTGSNYYDNFDDGVMDTVKWTKGIMSRPSSQFDASVPVFETGGALVITPKSSTSGDHYSGYISPEMNLSDLVISTELLPREQTIPNPYLA